MRNNSRLLLLSDPGSQAKRHWHATFFRTSPTSLLTIRIFTILHQITHEVFSININMELYLTKLNSLAIEAGVDSKTIASWISFYDTGLACSLLSISKESQLSLHPIRGNLFENYILSELIKDRYNKNIPFDLYFWRDSTGNEMDVIIDKGTHLYPVEIKAGKTIRENILKTFSSGVRQLVLQKEQLFMQGMYLKNEATEST